MFKSGLANTYKKIHCFRNTELNWKILLNQADFHDRPFHILEPQNPLVDFSKRQTIRQSADFEALKLEKNRTGCYQLSIEKERAYPTGPLTNFRVSKSGDRRSV